MFWTFYKEDTQSWLQQDCVMERFVFGFSLFAFLCTTHPYAISPFAILHSLSSIVHTESWFLFTDAKLSLERHQNQNRDSNISADSLYCLIISISISQTYFKVKISAFQGDRVLNRSMNDLWLLRTPEKNVDTFYPSTQKQVISMLIRILAFS